MDILYEANRCLKCKNPLCVKGCPVSTPINVIMELFLSGKIEEAGNILFNNNPLSALCALICPHENNCTGHCILNKKSEPVKFYEIEAYISSFFLEKSTLKNVIEKKKELIGIIGAGPAGLTLAFILASKGYKVTIIDSKDKIGGVLRYGIPEFRLPKSLLDKLLRKMEELDIKFRPNTLIGPTITIDDMFNDGYDAIFIGTGVWNPNRLHIKGESLGNAHFAIDYLKNPDSYNLGDNVVIIGGGNVAMDAARTILRKSRSKVSIVFFRGKEDITAINEELQLAILDGVEMKYYLDTVQILEDGVLVDPVIKEENSDGTISYKSDSSNRYKIDATSVIIAIGQGPLSNIVKNTKEIDTSKKGLIVATGNGITTRKGVFAAGDVVSGGRTVAEAVQFTKHVAEEIIEYLDSKNKKY